MTTPRSVAGAFVAVFVVCLGVLLVGVGLSSMSHPAHAFVHTGHDHVRYEATAVEGMEDIEDLERHDVVRTHAEATRELGLVDLEVASRNELPGDYGLWDVSHNDTVDAFPQHTPGEPLALTHYDYVHADGEWFRPHDAGNDTVRMERVDAQQVARAVAVRPDELPPEMRKTVDRVRDADGQVLLSAPDLPEHLLLRTDGGVVRVGGPLCYDCGYGGMGLAFSKLFVFTGGVLLALGVAIAGLGYLGGAAPERTGDGE